MKKIYIILLFCAIKLSAQNITAAEYFIDNDPGFGNATPVATVPQSANAQFSFTATNNQQSGTHILGYRTKDSNGKWSLTAFSTFNIVETFATSPMQSLEYFWDTDAGFGNNFIYPLASGVENVQDLMFNATIPPGLTLGEHSIFIRSYDGNTYSHTNYKLDVVLANLSFDSSGISVFPNPVVNELNINMPNGQKSRLVVYDINARSVVDREVDGSVKINLSHLSAGIYTAYFWNEQNQIYVVKLIKK